MMFVMNFVFSAFQCRVNETSLLIEVVNHLSLTSNIFFMYFIKVRKDTCIEVNN